MSTAVGRSPGHPPHGQIGYLQLPAVDVAASAAFLVVGFAALLVVQALNGGEQTWAASLPLFVAYFCLPVLFAVAVLRYRLYDIEVIINRAVVLAGGPPS